MDKKKLAIIIAISLVTIFLIIFGIIRYGSNRAGNISKPMVYPPQPSVDDPFKWGATVRPFALDAEMNREPLIDEQFALMEELGAKWARTDWLASRDTDWKILDETMEAAKRHGLGIVLIVDWQQEDIDIFDKKISNEEISQKAYDFATQVASRYKDRIHYYQLSAELGSLALANPLSAGFKASDYDNNKYGRIESWLKGTSEGIKKADSEAKRIIDSLWTHTGFIDRAIEGGIEFEVIGWDWYSNFGSDLTAIDIHAASGNKYNLVEELGKYGKEVWIAEANKSGGTLDGNYQAQADFTEQFAKYIYDQPLFTGFIFYELTDRVGVLEGEQKQGLVEHIQNGDHFILDKKKPAFYNYQKVIKESAK